MALRFPNGSVIGFSTTTASGGGFTTISNAADAVTNAAGVDPGDIVIVQSSGWSGIVNRATEVGAAGALTGIDTRDLIQFPAGEGAGTLLVAENFVEFSQQGDLTTSGGEQQFWTGAFLEDRSGRQIQVPTFKNAKTITLPLYFDPDLPWYDAAVSVSLKREPVVLRIRLPDGDTMYRYGYMSFDSDPTMSANNPMQVTMTFSSLGEATLVEEV